jgi:ubiquinone/menaquinone biosynthesis C-methylase UbiE
MKMEKSPDTQSNQEVHRTVRDGYAQIARSSGESCCGPSSCCGADTSEAASKLAQSVGYDMEELAALPEGANMGLSCGNPVALATLKPGEVIVDLGSGGGFDIFIAGRRVGPDGRAIGVDMTPEMLDKARNNTSAYRDSTGLDNVEFRLGEIEHLPVEDNRVDVVISNCVINLSPDKEQVWREIARVLKPGGRVAVSDMALLQSLTPQVAQMVEARIGCVAGAVLVEETEQMMKNAGLINIILEKKTEYVDSMTKWNDPLYLKIKETLPEGTKLGDYITSLSISAIKPQSCCQ